MFFSPHMLEQLVAVSDQFVWPVFDVAVGYIRHPRCCGFLLVLDGPSKFLLGWWVLKCRPELLCQERLIGDRLDCLPYQFKIGFWDSQVRGGRAKRGLVCAQLEPVPIRCCNRTLMMLRFAEPVLEVKR